MEAQKSEKINGTTEKNIFPETKSQRWASTHQSTAKHEKLIFILQLTFIAFLLCRLSFIPFNFLTPSARFSFTAPFPPYHPAIN